MAAQLSTVFHAGAHHKGEVFSVRRVDLAAIGEAASPVVGLDHYRMRGPTFAPHPHAGFSAVSYLFEDSPGGLRNRDSLGHDFVVQPGELVWTQAGSGVVHEEVPAEPGREVHGVQIFVNLSGKNKVLPPQVHRLTHKEVPEWRSASGDRVRVAAGQYGGVASSLTLTEPFDLLDMQLRNAVEFPVADGHNALVYVLTGELLIRSGDAERSVPGGGVVAIKGGGAASLVPKTPTHALVLAGAALHEPVFAHGPFIMNQRAQVLAAIERYESGAMGSL